MGFSMCSECIRDYPGINLKTDEFVVRRFDGGVYIYHIECHDGDKTFKATEVKN